MTKLTGSDKPTRIRNMFDSIAPRYDLMNAVMTFGLHQNMRRAAARIAQPPRNGLALDLATGTGDFAAALRQIEPTCRVVGIDFALEMMRLGKNKYNSRVAFAAGDMLRLPVMDSSVDCIVDGFVLRNVADVRSAFEEMHRVLRPGSRAVSLEIVSPHTPLWREIFGIYFNYLVPIIGGWLTGNPEAYHYLPRSVREFLSPKEVVGLMHGAGFREASFRVRAFGTMAIYIGVK
jgi:demethylmenaquinone methyltransferase / 2-methoxy-6-polyprenyl-1,4-benzoquinol methylase